MIEWEFQSLVTPPEEFQALTVFALLAIASFIIHYFGWQARSRFGSHCPRWGRFAQADCRHEMRPMTFLDPGAFVGTDPTKCPQLPSGPSERSRPAADATREVRERWLLGG